MKRPKMIGAPRPVQPDLPMGKNKKHEDLKAKAIEAVQELHGDTSVGNLVTREDLAELREAIEEMIAGIDADIERG